MVVVVVVAKHTCFSDRLGTEKNPGGGQSPFFRRREARPASMVISTPSTTMVLPPLTTTMGLLLLTTTMLLSPPPTAMMTVPLPPPTMKIISLLRRPVFRLCGLCRSRVPAFRLAGVAAAASRPTTADPVAVAVVLEPPLSSPEVPSLPDALPPPPRLEAPHWAHSP